jgi:hypothetical protein
MGSGKVRRLLGRASEAESGVPMRIPAEARDVQRLSDGRIGRSATNVEDVERGWIPRREDD